MAVQPTDVPLGEECYIQLFLPTDLEVELKSVRAEGIFKPKGNSVELSTADLNILPATPDEPRQSILFYGSSGQRLGRVQLQRAVRLAEELKINTLAG